MNGEPTTVDDDSEDREIELSSIMTAKRVRDSVQVKTREGNLVQTMFFSEEQIDQIKSLFEHEADETDGDNQ